MLTSVNPVNGKVVHSFEEDSLAKVEGKLKMAQKAFTTWRDAFYEERSHMLLTVAEDLRANKREYAALMTLEMGKMLKEAIAEVEKCAWVCEYYAKEGKTQLKDEILESDASKSYLHYEPLGVVLAVMPWNFPFWQVFRFAAPAIMAGNTVVLKHASNVPQCALAIEQLFFRATETTVFQTLLIGSKQVESVIMHPVIKAVTLTGSELAGSQVASNAGKNIKKTVLELGGSDPFIVLEDADIDHAVDVALKGRFLNCGQSCIAAKRFIVVEEIADAFITQFKEKVEALKVGDPLNNDNQCGPMAKEDLAEELKKQVDASVKMGAKIVCGGNHQSAFFEPTILTHVQEGMPAYEQELFGPVAAIIVVEGEEEAIRVANDSEFGLGGSVWTGDVKRGEAVARKVETGAMFVNGLVKSDPRLPFGGIKKSGYGRELSHLGIREFTNPKTIWIA